MATTYEIAVKIAGKLESTFSQSFMSAASTLQKHQDKITGVKKSLKELEEAHKQGKISAEEYAASYTKLTAELEKAKAAQEGLAKAVNFQRSMEEKASAARGKLLRSTALMTAALAGPVVAAMNFESAMADVRKVVDFETPQQFKEMSKDILDLSKRIPMAAKGLADIVAAAGQSGIAREDLISFAEDAAKMAIAFDISAEEAGTMMAQWRVAFKMPQKEVIRLADQVNFLSNNVNATAPQISSILTRIGPLGKIAGVSAADVAALGATVKAAGIESEVAATGLKNFILRLSSGASATNKQKEAFKSLGLSAAEMSKLMQKDARQAIITVLKALQKVPEHAQTAILTEIFGRESVSAIAPLITNLGELEKNFKLVSDASQYAGSMEREYEERSKTAANALRLMTNSINALAISLGDVLLPPLADAANSIANVANKIAKWADAHPKLTKVIVLGTAGLLAFRVAMAAAEFAIFSTISKLAKLYVFLVQHNVISYAAAIATKAWAAAQWLLNAAMSANPVALLVIAISGLVAALVILYKKSETVRNAMNALWGVIAAGATSVFQAVTNALNWVIDKVNWFIDKLNKIKLPSWLPMIGGKGVNIQMIEQIKAPAAAPAPVPGHAEGGVFSTPHVAMVAEKGPEAILPLDRLLGVIRESRTGTTAPSVNITYSPASPVINIYEQGGVSPEQIRSEVLRAERKAQEEFEARLKAFLAQQGRLSYA